MLENMLLVVFIYILSPSMPENITKYQLKIHHDFFCKFKSKVCNFNRELNQMDSCIAQSVHHPGDFVTSRNLSSFTACTSVIAAFLAVTENCVFFSN